MGLFFLKEKNEAFKEFSKLCKQLQIYKTHQLCSEEATMVENLIKKSFLNFVVIMELLKIFRHLAHPNKMV